MLHAIESFFGLTNASGLPYLFWSGICADLVYISAISVVYRKLNCHVDGCKRVGLHHVEGTPFITCKKHHPRGGNTADSIRDAHTAAQHLAHHAARQADADDAERAPAS